MRQFCPKRSVSRSYTDVVHRSSVVTVPFDVPTIIRNMPAEKISEMTEHQISTDEEDSQKQSNLHNNGPPEVFNEASIPSTNELTNGLKRQLSDELKDSDKTKKVRFTENGKEDKLEATSLNNGNNITATLLKKLDQFSGSIENKDEKKSNVSNEIKHVNNETNKSLNIINHNGNNGIGDEDCKEDSSNKETNSKDIDKDKESKTSSTNNIINECEFIEYNEETTKNVENELVEEDFEEDAITDMDISDLNRSSSSSDNLVIVENVDHEDVADVIDVIENSLVTENISPVANDLTTTEHNLNNTNTSISEVDDIVIPKENDTQLLLENDVPSINKNTNSVQTQTTESQSNNNNTKANTEVDVSDQDCEVIDSDTNLHDNVNGVINRVSLTAKENITQLLKLCGTKELPYDQFDSYFTHKFIEIMTERLHNGKDRSDIQLMKEREKFWRTKYSSLHKQFKELQSILKIHMADIKVNKNARPHLITRTVGLQAVLSEKIGGSMQLPKLMNPPPKPNNNPVNISDDDDDIAIVEVESAKPSCSKTVTKMQSPPQNIVTQLPIVSPKAIPAKMPSNSIFNDTNTIDLTGNDESDIINLDEPITSYKVIHHQSPGKLPAQLNGNLPNHITYIEVPNHPSTSSGFIVKASTSGSPQRTTGLNRDTITKGDPKSTNLKPFIISEVSRVDPVLVQPCTVTYTTQHVPVSHISGSLQTISTVPFPTCQLPVTLTQTSSGTSITTCQLPISIRAIPSHTSVDQSVTVSQPPLQPPPLAIPIISRHPAKLPEIPNQRSLTSWKRLPPAPRVSLSRTLERSGPQALVLSWTMPLNKTISEITSYQIFAYQEISSVPPRVDLWKKIGSVNALALPMACSLSQFTTGERYHFAVRAVDVYTRVGPFSLPQTVYLD